MTEVDADRQEPTRPCRGAGASCPWSVVRCVQCQALPTPSFGRGPGDVLRLGRAATDNGRLSTKSRRNTGLSARGPRPPVGAVVGRIAGLELLARLNQA